MLRVGEKLGISGHCDTEWFALCFQATIAGGGVIPHIHKSLIGKKAEGPVAKKA